MLMSDENNKVKEKKENRMLWDEPYFGSVHRGKFSYHCLFIPDDKVGKSKDCPKKYLGGHSFMAWCFHCNQKMSFNYGQCRRCDNEVAKCVCTA